MWWQTNPTETHLQIFPIPRFRKRHMDESKNQESKGQILSRSQNNQATLVLSVKTEVPDLFPLLVFKYFS